MTGKISLFKLVETEMSKARAGYEVVQNPITGRICGCGCYFVNSGGSSSENNRNANKAIGAASPLPSTNFSDLEE